MKSLFEKFLRDENGSVASEYALLISIFAVTGAAAAGTPFAALSAFVSDTLMRLLLVLVDATPPPGA